MGFQVQKRLTISGSTAIYIEADITATSGMFFYALPIQITPNQGNIFIDTFLANSSNASTIWTTPLNLNGLSSTASKTTIKLATTVSGTPIGVREYSIGAPLTNQSSGGGTPLLDIPKIINNSLGKKLYFKIANQETATIVVDACLIWYEIPPYVGG